MYTTIKVVFRCVFCLYLFSNSANARESVNKDSIEVVALVKIARENFDENIKKSLIAANQIIKLSQEKNYELGFVKGYSLLGLIFQRMADYKQSIIYFQKVVDVGRNNQYKKEKSSALYNVSGVYQFVGDYKKSFECGLEALSIGIQLGDSVFIAKCYDNIAQCLSIKGDEVHAIYYFKKAIDIERMLNSNYNLCTSLNNLSIAYNNQKNYDTSLIYLYLARDICKKIGDEGLNITVDLNIGTCYDYKGMKDSAERYYLMSLEKAIQFEDKHSQVVLLNNLGRINFSFKKNYALAEKFLLQAYSIADSIDSNFELKEIQKSLAKLYFEKADYKQAYLSQQKFIVLSDSLMNLDKIKAIEEISARFEIKEMEESNKLLKNRNDLQAIKVKQKNYLIYGIAILSSLIFIIFILYLKQNKYKTQKESLDIEQKLLQIQMNPHFIFNSLQAIQSFVLTNKVEQSSSYLTSFSRLMRLILENSKQEFISLAKEIETLSYYLQLQKLRFKEIFEYEITVDDKLNKNFYLVPPMILQPFIENAIEHGFKNLKVKGKLNFNIRKKNDYLVLEIVDNGWGIDEVNKSKLFTKPSHHSYALEIINERIKILNLKLKQSITLYIEDISKKDKFAQGTRITIDIPFINL